MKPMPEAKWPPRIETAYSSFYGWNVRTKEELSEPVKEFSTTEYLSRAESEHLLSEAVAKAVADAVREAKADAYEESANMVNRALTHSMEDQAIARLRQKAAELRENGGNSGQG